MHREADRLPVGPAHLAHRLQRQTALLTRRILTAGCEPAELEERQVLTEEEYKKARAEFGESFEAGMGAEAVKRLLERFHADGLHFLPEGGWNFKLQIGPVTDMGEQGFIPLPHRAPVQLVQVRRIEEIPHLPPGFIKYLFPFFILIHICFHPRKVNELYQGYF